MTNLILPIDSWIASVVGDRGAPALFWPLVGIASVLIVAFILSKLVRGDPYYDRNAGRDQRDRGGAPFPGGDGGDDGSGGSWF